MEYTDFVEGDEVRIKSKSIGLDFQIVAHTHGRGSLIGKIGRVHEVLQGTIYVSVDEDLLAFTPEDLELVGFPQRSKFIK